MRKGKKLKKKDKWNEKWKKERESRGMVDHMNDATLKEALK